MSDLLKGRLMLLATASTLALAIFAWGDMASAQEAPAEDATDVSVDSEMGAEIGTEPGDDGAADAGETTEDEGATDGDVTAGEVFDGEVIDDGSVTFEIGIIDPEEGPDVIIDDFIDGEVIEGEPGASDGSEGDPAGGDPADPDLVLEDPVWMEDGAGVTDGGFIDMPMILQSGTPEVRSNAEGAAPLPPAANTARKPATSSDRDETCSTPLQNGFCVTN